MLFNHTKTYFLQRVRDKLIAALQNGEDRALLQQSLFLACEKLRYSGPAQQPGPLSWGTSETELAWFRQLDGMRHLLNLPIGAEETVCRLTRDYGFLQAEALPLRVTFFCQEFDLFPSFRSVWDAMDDSEAFARHAVFVWKNDNGNPVVQQYVEENDRLYHDSGIPVEDVRDYDLTRDQPDLCFFMKPYYALRGLPPRLQIAEVNRHTPFTVFISYCLDVQGGKKLNEFFYGMQAFYDFWKIVGYSAFYRSMTVRYGYRNGENVELLGHPKFDEIYRMQQSDRWRREEWERQIAGRPVIMWNSHFSISPGKGVGTFLRWNRLLFDYFDAHRDIVLLWRPHPIFWQTIYEEKSVDREAFDRQLQALQAQDNVIIDRYGDYHYAFAAADALISDAATFLVEFAATGKPVLYTPKPDGEGVIDQSATEHLYLGRTEEELLAYLDHVRTREDPMREARLAGFRREYGEVDGQIGIRIRDRIVEAMRQELEHRAEEAVHNSRLLRGRKEAPACTTR